MFEKKKERSIASILFADLINQKNNKLFHTAYIVCALDINQSLEISVKKLFVKDFVYMREANRSNKSLETLKENNVIFKDYISKHKVNEYIERYLPIIIFKNDKNTKPTMPRHKDEKKNKDVNDKETTQIP